MSPLLTLVFLLSLVVIDEPLHVSSKTWCLSALSATDAELQANIDWGCSKGKVDCGPIQPGGVCFLPDSLGNHASYVMNAYYQANHERKEACDWNDTAQVVLTEPPTQGDCKF
ncbi:unnamed protein product [Cochlearia groenlandica]